MPRVPLKNKNNYTISMPHSVPRQQICTIIWRMSVFRKKKFYKDANQTENFIGAKIENDLYYRGEKHY